MYEYLAPCTALTQNAILNNIAQIPHEARQSDPIRWRTWYVDTTSDPGSADNKP